MIEMVKFEPAHALEIDVQQRQFDHTGMMNLEYATNLAASGVAMSGISDGRVLFCGGVAKIWEGRYSMWSLLSEDARRHMVRMTKIGKRMISTLPAPARIEMIVKHDFEEAHRWAKLLGFDLHHHEEKYLPDGADADIYVRFI